MARHVKVDYNLVSRRLAEGVSPAQIAERMSLPVGTVRAVCSRLRREMSMREEVFSSPLVRKQAD